MERCHTNVCFIGHVLELRKEWNYAGFGPKIRLGLVQEVICDYCNNAHKSIQCNLLKGSEKPKRKNKFLSVYYWVL